MTEDAFLAELKRIGLNPADHDVPVLHAAFVRLTGLLGHLDTDESREMAKALARFDPRDPP